MLILPASRLDHPFGPHFGRCHVRIGQLVDSNIKETEILHGANDILVNNAATIIYRPPIETTLDEWNRILAVNLTGAFLYSRAARVMIPRKSGAIVNIASYACFFGFPQIAAYAASQGGSRN